MVWIEISEALPSGEVLIYAEGQVYLAVLVRTGEPAFLDLHSSDVLPWPSHWMELPAPPV